MDSEQPFGGGSEPYGGQPSDAQPPYQGQPSDPTQPYQGQPSGPPQQPYQGQPPYGQGQPPYPGQQSYPGQPSGPSQQPYQGQPPYSQGQPPGPAQQPYGQQPPYGQAPPSGAPQQPYPGAPSYPGQQPPFGQSQPYGTMPGQAYGAGQPPYSGGRPKVRPGRVWYVAPAVLVVAAIAWLVIGLTSLNSKVDGFARVPLPAGGAVTLNSGGYVIYYEGPGAASGEIPAFNIRIIPDSASAKTGSLKSYSGDVNYKFGSHDGRAVLSFQVAHGGKFLVEPTGAPGDSDLAFGTSVVGGIVGTVLICIALGLIGVALWVVLLVVRIVKVRRARQAAMAPVSPYGPVPGSY